MDKKVEYRRKLKFNLALLLIGAIPLLLAGVCLALLSISNLSEEIKQGVETELKIATDQVRAYYAYDIKMYGDINYDTEIDQEYMEILQDEEVELSLFQKDVSIMTSFKKSDGTYALGETADSDIYKRVSAGEIVLKENVNINNEKYYVCYRPIYDGNDQFWGMSFAGEKQSQVTKIINEVVWKIIVVTTILIVIIILVVTFIANRFTRAILRVIESINVLSEGKLSADFSCKSAIREIMTLAHSGKSLGEKLHDAVSSTKTVAVDLKRSITEVEELTITSAEGTERISKAMNEFSSTSQTLSETVLEVNTRMGDIGASIDNITEHIGEMNATSEESNEANKIAADYMGKLKDASDRTATVVDEISKKISECSEAVEKIKTAAVVITEISSQTNLLSLNASIEAARAGEAGRGFAVVASEIQTLADQSNRSASEIQAVISEILGKVEECVDKADEMTGVIEQQAGFLGETREKISDMSEASKKLSDGVQAIDKEAHVLIEFKDAVINSVTDLSAVSEENSASSEEVNVSIGAIVDAVEDTKKEANTMKNLANELEEKMGFFKN